MLRYDCPSDPTQWRSYELTAIVDVADCSSWSPNVASVTVHHWSPLGGYVENVGLLSPSMLVISGGDPVYHYWFAIFDARSGATLFGHNAPVFDPMGRIQLPPKTGWLGNLARRPRWGRRSRSTARVPWA